MLHHPAAAAGSARKMASPNASEWSLGGLASVATLVADAQRVRVVRGMQGIGRGGSQLTRVQFARRFRRTHPESQMN